MAVQAKIAGIDIPLLYSQLTRREIVGDRERTAGGKLRSDITAVKRTWELRTRPMPSTQSSLLASTLDGLLFGVTTLWLQEFGSTGNAVAAFVTDFEETRDVETQARRSLTITVEEQ